MSLNNNSQQEVEYDDVRHIEESDMTVQSNLIDPNQKIEQQDDQFLSPKKQQQTQNNSIQISEPQQNPFTQNNSQVPSQKQDNDNKSQQFDKISDQLQGNPMQSVPDFSQLDNQDDQADNEDENAEQDYQLQMKQVVTEVTEQKNTITPPPEQNKLQSPSELHKKVLNSPRRQSPEELYQLHSDSQQSAQHEKVDLVEKYKNVKIIENNIKEIYMFYAKQAQITNKQATFDQLYQTTNAITLQKYMYFCKDFNLIDLHITPQFVEKLGGKWKTNIIIKGSKQQQRKIKSGQERSIIVLNKFLLVEIFKKNCSNQQELNLLEFQNILYKLAEVMFAEIENPNEICLFLLFEYLELKDPKAYRKKMIIVGKPFNTKDKAEVVTQEKLYSRRIVLPPKPRATSVKEETLPQIEEKSIPPPKKSQKLQPKIDKNLLKWEDLNQVVKEFDPKELLLEQDLSDKEDDYYLQEYQIKQPKIEAKSSKREVGLQKKVKQSAKELNQSYQDQEYLRNQKTTKLRELKKLTHIPTKAMLNQSYEVQKTLRQDEDSQIYLKKVEKEKLEREKLIYQALMKKQYDRENKVSVKRKIN